MGSGNITDLSTRGVPATELIVVAVRFSTGSLLWSNWSVAVKTLRRLVSILKYDDKITLVLNRGTEF